MAAQSTFVFRLPRISSLRLGLNYTFVLEATTVAVTDTVTIMTQIDSSADIRGVFTSNSTLTSGQSIASHTSVGALWGQVIAVTSHHWQLRASQQGEEFINEGTVDIGPGWTTGTTST